MSLKEEAAKKAVTLIQDNSTLGLGAGSTVSHIISFLKEEIEKRQLTIQLLTSSFTTFQLLRHQGFDPVSLEAVSSVDLYFDSCDQFDQGLNALKSGGGIHTLEKLLASMAEEFVIVADESKYTEQFNAKFPLVVELIPASMAFVSARIQKIFPGVRVAIRTSDKKDGPVLTERGNYLYDLWFEKWPDLSSLNSNLKNITGVLETSLFYKMAKKAIIAGGDGVKVLNGFPNSF